MVDVDIYIDSGNAYHLYLTETDIVNVEITDSDDTYYQNGVLITNNLTAANIPIGKTIQIQLDNKELFNGYISRKQLSTIGTKLIQFQIVGKTYDLWRYIVDDDEYPTSGNTGYIASSLVHLYMPATYKANIPNSIGVYVDNINLANNYVGDAISTLSKYDGYSFKISSNYLIYYKPTYINFTIDEEDIIEMSPVEEADEDIINHCIVLGGTDYSTKINQQSRNTKYNITGGITIAQRFKPTDNIVSAVKLYLDRTIEPNQPGNLKFSIRSDIGSDVTDNFFYDSIADDIFLDNTTNSNMGIYNNYTNMRYVDIGQLSPSRSFLAYDAGYTPGILQHTYNKYNGYKVNAIHNTHVYNVKPSSMKCFKVTTYLNNNNQNCIIWCGLVNGDTYNINNLFASTATYVPAMGVYYYEVNFYFELEKQPLVLEDQEYSVIFWRTDGGYVGIAHEYYGGGGSSAYSYAVATSSDGTTWTDTGKFVYYGCNSFAFYNNTASIKTNVINSMCKYMIISAQTSGNASKIKFSGSNNNGTNWYKLTNGTEYTFGSEDDDILAWINILTNAGGLDCQSIKNMSIEIQNSTHTSGEPSNTNLEWSDNISWSATDLPYPSGWSGWKTYTSPILTLPNENSYHWFLISGTNSTSSKYWSIYYMSNQRVYASGGIKIFTGGDWVSPGKSHWPSGDLCFQVGFTEGDIKGEYKDDYSISIYGRHLKIINESTINSSDDANSLAYSYVSSNINPTKKGTLTIQGNSSITTNHKISANILNLDISEAFDVVSYTHSINKERGYITTINYGLQPFDVMKRITDLESKV